MHGHTINRGDDVSADESSLVRWCTSSNGLKGCADIAVSRFKFIYPCGRSRRRNSRHAATCGTDYSRYLLDECCKCTRGYEENEQTYKHPGRAANAATSFTNFPSRWY